MLARIALFLAVTLSALSGQTGETPPDTKAYNAALAVADPGQKIEALLKFKTDFPESLLLASADQGILSTLLRKFPGQTTRIRQFASAMLRGANPSSRGALANSIALQFLTAGVLLNDARSYARRGVEAMSFATYVNDQTAAYRRRGQTLPWTADLEKRFRESRAPRAATLGRIELSLGHTAKARQLLEEAYSAQPGNVTIQAALGELEAKNGNHAKALEYLIPAVLSGNAPREANAALEAVYRQQNGNSSAGLEAMLNSEYHKRYPNPVNPEPYKPSPARTDRMVLAELFTGSGCGPCAAADLAFDAAMQQYSGRDLAVIMYHQHIPRPDPMTNPDTQGRHRSYAVQGVPTFVIDGKKTLGGGSREMTKQVYDRLNPDIQKALDTPAEAKLKIEARIAGSMVHVQAAVDTVKSDSPDLKLQIALVEKELRFSGESGIRFHPMVVRAMGGKDGAGFALDPAQPKTFEQSFDIERVSTALKTHLDAYEASGHRGEIFTFAEKMYRINHAGLAVVVFVQDDKTKHVLQAAYVDLGSTPAHTVTEAAGGRR